MNRRRFLTFALAAPAIIRTPGLLMPVRVWTKPTPIKRYVITAITITEGGLFVPTIEPYVAPPSGPFFPAPGFVPGDTFEIAPPRRLV